MNVNSVLEAMPDDEDDFGTFLGSPLPSDPPASKKIEKRRNTTAGVRGYDADIESPSVPFRKRCRSPHSSVLALKLKSENIDNGNNHMGKLILLVERILSKITRIICSFQKTD